jgi:hypothetical protein
LPKGIKLTMSKLLINETPLQFLPTLALALGGERPAIALQQLHYMLMTPRMSETREGRRWVRASYAQWQDEFFPCWSVWTIQRIFADLRARGLVLYEQHEIETGDATGSVSIDYEALESLPHVALSATCHVADSVVDHVAVSATSTYREEDSKKNKKKLLLQPDPANPAAAPNARRRRKTHSAPAIEQKPITAEMLSHFAVAAHREIMGVLLDSFCMEQIMQAVTDGSRWREVLTDWRLHPRWHRDNISGQLDKYKTWGTTPAGQPATKQGAPDVAESWLDAARAAGMDVDAMQGETNGN